MGIMIAEHTYHVIELERIPEGLFESLNASFGPPGPRWWFSHYKIYFRDKLDHLMFLLKWS